MKHRDFELLDLLEGKLDGESLLRVETSLASSPEAKRAIEEYRILLETERALAQKEASLSPAFAVAVMEKIEEETTLSPLSRFTIALYTSRWSLPSYLVTVCALVLVIFQSINPSSPLFLPFSTGREEANLQKSVELLLPVSHIQAGAPLESSLLKVRAVPLRQVSPGSILAAEAGFVFGKRALSSMAPEIPLRRDQIDWSTPPPMATTRTEEGENLRPVTIEADLNAIPLQVLNPGRYVEVQLRVKKQDARRTVFDTPFEAQTLSRFSRVVSVSTVPGDPPRTTLQLLLAQPEEELLQLAQTLPSSLVLLDRHVEATSLLALNEFMQEEGVNSVNPIRTVSLTEQSEEQIETLSSDCTLSIREFARKSAHPLVRHLCVSARAATDLKPGTILTHELLMLRLKTPTTSIDLPTTPSLSHLVGRSTTEFIPKGDLVTEKNTR